MLAAAASIVAIGALAGWNVFLANRVSAEQLARTNLARIVNVASEPGSHMVGLRESRPRPEQILASYAEGSPHIWIVGVNVPAPAPGNIYRVWLNDAGDFILVDEFRPAETGWVERFLTFDLTHYDELIITEEPRAALMRYPAGPLRWAASADSPTASTG